MSVPKSIRPVVSSVTCAWSGTRNACAFKILGDAIHGRFDFEDVLLCFEQEHIHTAFDQPRACSANTSANS